MHEIVIHETARHHPSEFALGAYHDGELIGMVVCDMHETPAASIVIVVKSEWRGGGVGRSLLNRMVECAPDLGLMFLTMSYSVANEAASKLVASSDAVVARRLTHGVVKAALVVQSNVAVVPIAA